MHAKWWVLRQNQCVWSHHHIHSFAHCIICGLTLMLKELKLVAKKLLIFLYKRVYKTENDTVACEHELRVYQSPGPACEKENMSHHVCTSVCVSSIECIFCYIIEISLKLACPVMRQIISYRKPRSWEDSRLEITGLTQDDLRIHPALISLWSSSLLPEKKPWDWKNISFI